MINKSMFIHLTNYSINKNYTEKSSKSNLEHCKKTLDYVLDQISFEGHDTDILMAKIHDIII